MTNIQRVVLCNCEGSMQIDPESASAALGGAKVIPAKNACTGDIDVAAKALEQDGTTLIACGQMANLFEELAEELDADSRLATVDIRDRAGWTADGNAFAKQAALLAEAMLPTPTTPAKDVVSEGTCLILGAPDVALPAANALSDQLAVTCLLDEAPEELTPPSDFDVALGGLKAAHGALGAFTITVDSYSELRPGGRGAAGFADPVDDAKSECDIILDLRGETVLFPADHKRDGYVRADPRDPLAVERALARARDFQGVFEKPLYIRFDETLCAHSRATQNGCDRCLNVCPTGAILPQGDVVSIDPDICAGCGACAAVCPSGAASYDDPPVGALFTRLRTLATSYREAGGQAPRALFHDSFGEEMIALSARFGKGLPADVIPVSVPNVEGVGHAEQLAALGVGFTNVFVLAGPKSDKSVIEAQCEISEAIAGENRIALLDLNDPDALDSILYADPQKPLSDPILPMGGRREVTRLAATAIAGNDAVIPLPHGAPYGAAVINTDACTLCLACVSLCPANALADNPDKPEVRFQETACLQCGICANTCPENAITLEPRLNTGKEALSHQTLHGEEPFECIECGTPFGVKSTIERIVEKLDGKNWMYSNSDNTKLIQMCDTCRISAQYHQDASPFKMGDRPAVRTTEDYLKDRKS